GRGRIVVLGEAAVLSAPVFRAAGACTATRDYLAWLRQPAVRLEHHPLVVAPCWIRLYFSNRYMPDLLASIDIPHRALFKAAEVGDLVKVQPYVLRSWESEFPELGVAKNAGSPRVYRRSDVEQVL